VETERSRARRGPQDPELDPHVLDQLKAVQDEAKDEAEKEKQ
jgi:hypothetical protein